MVIKKENRTIFVWTVEDNLQRFMNPREVIFEEMKRECLKMYVNGLGFRAIERVKNVHHTTIMNWVKQVGELLPDYYDPQTIPDVGELDELETFVGSKKTKSGYGQR